MLFGHGVEQIHRAAAHQPEVAGVGGDLHIRQARQQAIEQMGRGFLEGGLALTAGALAIDHVAARIHHLHHLRQQFGRVLQIAIEDQDPLPPAQLQASGERQLMPVVARQVDRDDVRIACGQRGQKVPGAVAGAIVDEHELVALPGAGQTNLAHPPMQLWQGLALIETGDDDGEGQSFHGRSFLKPN